MDYEQGGIPSATPMLLTVPCQYTADATPESGHSTVIQANARSHNACNIMNAESKSNFESLVGCILDGTITQKQLQDVLYRLAPVSDQSSTYLTSSKAMDQVHYFRFGLDKAHSSSKCPHVSNLKTSIHSSNFQNKRSRRKNEKQNGH